MSGFILALVASSFALSQRLFGWRTAGWSLLLLASFAPLYGHGKNAIGEIPGTFFLVLGLFLATFLSGAEGKRRTLLFAGTGLALGLSMAAKPIFLIMIPPALVLAWILHRRERIGTLTERTVLVIAAGAAVLLWIVLQFSGDSLAATLSIYAANPNESSLVTLVLAGLKRLVTEAQPLYFLLLELVWLASALVRMRAKQPIHLSETLALAFSILLSLAFLKTVGYYRYFFPAQWLALVFLPSALDVLVSALASKVKKLSEAAFRRGIFAMAMLLVLFQLYQTFFSSWVSAHYASTRSRDLHAAFQELDPEETIFLYNVPEVEPFIPHRNYFQYLMFSREIKRGREMIARIAEGVPERVVVRSDAYDADPSPFAGYTVETSVDRYLMLRKQP